MFCIMRNLLSIVVIAAIPLACSDTDSEFDTDWALEFDGESGGASTTTTISPDVGDQFTLEGWFYFDSSSTSSNEQLAGSGDKNQGFMLHRMSYSPFPVAFLFVHSPEHATGAVSNVGMPADEWIYIAGTYDNGSVQIYVDGQPGDPSSNPDGMISSTLPFEIGFAGWSNSSFEGKTDEIRVSSVIRYTSSFTPSTSFESDADTIALWKFNEGDGSTSSDASDNANDLEIGPGVSWVNH